jgi:hypothetical protein
MLPFKPGAVAHTCNPTYSRGSSWEDGDSKAIREKVQEAPSEPIKS